MKKIMSYTNLPESQCPTCGYKVGAASVGADVCESNNPRHPQPGDLSICFKCGELLVFGRDLRLSLASINDVIDLDKKEFGIIEMHQAKIRKERPMG